MEEAIQDLDESVNSKDHKEYKKLVKIQKNRNRKLFLKEAWQYSKTTFAHLKIASKSLIMVFVMFGFYIINFFKFTRYNFGKFKDPVTGTIDLKHHFGKKANKRYNKNFLKLVTEYEESRRKRWN